MTEKMKKSFTDNWAVITIFLIGIVFNIGINYQMLNAKPDKEEVIEIVDTKIKDHRENDKDIYFKGIDGVELKTKINNMENTLNEIKQILNNRSK